MSSPAEPGLPEEGALMFEGMAAKGRPLQSCVSFFVRWIRRFAPAAFTALYVRLASLDFKLDTLSSPHWPFGWPFHFRLDPPIL
jgi:hypothetical protein